MQFEVETDLAKLPSSQHQLQIVELYIYCICYLELTMLIIQLQIACEKHYGLFVSHN